MSRLILSGERVQLQSPSKGDVTEFLAAVRRSRSLHRPWASPPSSPDAFEAYLRRSRRRDFRGLFVRRLNTGALVGVYNVSQIIRGPLQSAFLGYYAFRPHAGMGYMTDGLRLTLRVVFETLSLHRIEANIQPANRASIALVRRCGFRKEGFSPRYVKIGRRWRDHERWAVTIEDWKRED